MKLKGNSAYKHTSGDPYPMCFDDFFVYLFAGFWNNDAQNQMHGLHDFEKMQYLTSNGSKGFLICMLFNSGILY